MRFRYSCCAERCFLLGAQTAAKSPLDHHEGLQNNSFGSQL
jgi:hypothetical protein